MANLAVLDADAELNVLALHVNFWAASERSISRSKAFIDIGLRFSFSQNGGQRIDFCVPCEISNNSNFKDLNLLVLANGTRDLIFGVDTRASNNVIEYRRSGTTVKDEVVQIAKFEVVNSKAKGDSHVAVHFPSPLIKDKTYYLRFRYSPKNLNSLIASKGWGDGRRGYLMDLRVNDIRESVIDSPFDDAREFCDVGEVNAFAILPASMNVVSNFPPFKHMRILESKAWREYLGSHQNDFHAEKHTIHYWRETDIRKDKPFRGFIHVHKEFGRLALGLFLLLLALSLVSVFLGMLSLQTNDREKTKVDDPVVSESSVPETDVVSPR